MPRHTRRYASMPPCWEPGKEARLALGCYFSLCISTTPFTTGLYGSSKLQNDGRTAVNGLSSALRCRPTKPLRSPCPPSPPSRSYPKTSRTTAAGRAPGRARALLWGSSPRHLRSKPLERRCGVRGMGYGTHRMDEKWGKQGEIF